MYEKAEYGSQRKPGSPRKRPPLGLTSQELHAINLERVRDYVSANPYTLVLKTMSIDLDLHPRTVSGCLEKLGARQKWELAL